MCQSERENMQQKDVQICDLLKNKDAKGMEFLFEEYYKPLVVWGDTFLNDVSRSEDLVTILSFCFYS